MKQVFNEELLWAKHCGKRFAYIFSFKFLTTLRNKYQSYRAILQMRKLRKRV